MLKKFNISVVRQMGMEVFRWQHRSCTAHFGFQLSEPKWVTLYDIQSLDEGLGHATELLREAKKVYEAQGFKFGGSIALNERMRKIYQELNIEEYAQ